MKGTISIYSVIPMIIPLIAVIIIGILDYVLECEERKHKKDDRKDKDQM